MDEKKFINNKVKVTSITDIQNLNNKSVWSFCLYEVLCFSFITIALKPKSRNVKLRAISDVIFTKLPYIATLVYLIINIVVIKDNAVVVSLATS